MADPDSEDPVSTGWDEARHSARPTPESPNPLRMRLWRQSQIVTLTAAAFQLAPVAIVIWSNSDRVAILMTYFVMVYSLLVVLSPWLLVNYANLFYTAAMPVFCGIAQSIYGRWYVQTLPDEIIDWTKQFFSNSYTWEFWCVRTALLAAMVQIGYKTIRMWGKSKADKDAIRYWWRRPKNEEAISPWT